MIIHLINSCGLIDYKFKLQVNEYKMSQQAKGTAIIIAYGGKQLTIPLANIAMIEEAL